MISKSQEKLIRSLQTKKGRTESGRCLVEGKKVIQTAGSAVEFTFTKDDTDEFEKLVTTESPSDIAGVARIPQWTAQDIASRDTIVVLDGVQDPGNVGAIMRLCLGFDASLILVESADPSAPKVVRASVGALFQIPWITVDRSLAPELIAALDRPVYRLELGGTNTTIPTKPCIFVAGSEGHGITLNVVGTPLTLPHDPKLESLNVGHALAIILSKRYSA